MTVQRRAEARHILLEDILSDDEITIFPDSSVVLDATAQAMTSNVTPETGGTTFYGDEPDERKSAFYISWKRTESIFYFGIAIIVFVLLAFCICFLYNFFVLKREPGRSDKFGVKWTRLREG